MNQVTKISLIFFGTLFVLLGIIGAFLTVLPTTPFLILASVCYAKSSRYFYDWLLGNRLCGEYIKNYKEGRGMRKNHKIFAISILCLTIRNSAIVFVSKF